MLLLWINQQPSPFQSKQEERSGNGDNTLEASFLGLNLFEKMKNGNFQRSVPNGDRKWKQIPSLQCSNMAVNYPLHGGNRFKIIAIPALVSWTKEQDNLNP